MKSLNTDILKFITTGDGIFEDLALRLFAYQYAHNEPYRRLVDARGVSPQTVSAVDGIPHAPVRAFKYATIACFAPDSNTICFESSGTTNEARRSRHYLQDTVLYEASLCRGFAEYLLADHAQLRFVLLMPSHEQMPHSSLAFMLDGVAATFGQGQAVCIVDATGELKMERFAAAVADAARPLCLVGTSLALVHLLEVCQREHKVFRLPPGSRLMDTGGFKGVKRAVPQDHIYRMAGDLLGIPPTHCVNEYGMSEMCSQFYDRVTGSDAPRRYRGPHWVRTAVVEPETLSPQPHGAQGLLRHTDLANVDSLAFLQTEDVGIFAAGDDDNSDDGFLLLDRLPGAEPRGCSRMMDEMIGEHT